MSKVHRIKCGNGNCYIIENGMNAILVDTGKKEYINQVLKACEPYSVKLIVLTHAHFDHAENAAQIFQALRVPIGMNEKDYGLIESNANQKLFPKLFWVKLYCPLLLKIFQHDLCVHFNRVFC